MPPTKISRIRYETDARSNGPQSPFQRLDDDVFRLMLSYLPRHQFRFVALVDRRFRRLYGNDTSTEYKNAVQSAKTMKIWFQDRNPTLMFARRMAVQYGGLEGLRWLKSHLGRGFEVWIPECEAAAEYGHLPVLQWLRSLDPPCSWDRSVLFHAVRNGDLPMVQWICSQRDPIVCYEYSPHNEHDYFAAGFGHLHILQWRHRQYPDQEFSERVLVGAASNGRLEILRWLRSRVPLGHWSVKVTAGAAGRNKIPVLEYLRSLEPPCPWDETVCASAARVRPATALYWLRAQDPPCPWNVQAIRENGGHDLITHGIHLL